MKELIFLTPGSLLEVLPVAMRHHNVPIFIHGRVDHTRFAATQLLPASTRLLILLLLLVCDQRMLAILPLAPLDLEVAVSFVLFQLLQYYHFRASNSVETTSNPELPELLAGG